METEIFLSFLVQHKKFFQQIINYICSKKELVNSIREKCWRRILWTLYYNWHYAYLLVNEILYLLFR